MPYIQANGLNIYYEIYGSGQPLIFINGLYSTTDSWINQINDLKKSFQVIVYDCRDQGKTEVPQNDYEINEHPKDLNALLDALEIFQANILGISHGSFVAMRFAVMFPQRVKKLILVSAVSEETALATHTAEFSRQLRDQYGMKIYYKMLMTYAIGEEYFGKIAHKINEMADQFEKKSQESVSLFRIFDIARTHYPYTQYLRQIQALTLILVGEQDRYTPVSRAKIIQEQIKNSRLSIIPNSGHSVHLEQPEELNRLVRDFLLQEE